MDRPNRMLLPLGAVMIVALIGLAVFFWLRPHAYNGVVIDPPLEPVPFSLQHYDGSTVTEATLRGRVALLFFGYTSCPDVCPTTLAEFRLLAGALGDQAGEVAFVFVTVDPQRDTPQQLRRYVGNFDRRFYGLTGSDQALDALYRPYGVYHEKRELGSAAGYLVDHTASVYVLDRQGRLVLTFPYGLGWQAMLEDVRALLRE